MKISAAPMPESAGFDSLQIKTCLSKIKSSAMRIQC